MIYRLVLWLRDGWHKLSSLRGVDDDPVSAICNDAMERNRLASTANKEAAADTVLAVKAWRADRAVDQQQRRSYI
jgi:hypothetical protein